jgi:predicted dithiol-disulfide oxidoreductase (DUF899 family)
MVDHAVVSREEWVVARKELLEKEKQLTRLKDDSTSTSRPRAATRTALTTT